MPLGLHVSSLPDSVVEADVRAYFSNFGALRRVRVVPPRVAPGGAPAAASNGTSRSALLEFVHDEHAAACVRAADKQFFPNGRQRMRVTFQSQPAVRQQRQQPPFTAQPPPPRGPRLVASHSVMNASAVPPLPQHVTYVVVPANASAQQQQHPTWVGAPMAPPPPHFPHDPRHAYPAPSFAPHPSAAARLDGPHHHHAPPMLEHQHHHHYQQQCAFVSVPAPNLAPLPMPSPPPPNASAQYYHHPEHTPDEYRTYTMHFGLLPQSASLVRVDSATAPSVNSEPTKQGAPLPPSGL